MQVSDNTRYANKLKIKDDSAKYRIRYGVKHNICVKGQVCNGGSMLLNSWVASYDAQCLKGLKNFKFVKMLRLDEFGSGSNGDNTVWSQIKNPVRAGYPVGGSSSGAPPAICANEIDFAIVTDTGGSSRAPAVQCGIVGFKPTYGVISRYGVMPLAQTLDCVSIMCAKKNLKHLENFYCALRRHRKKDQTATEILKKKKNKLSVLNIGPKNKKLSEFSSTWSEFITLLKNIDAVYKDITDPIFASNILRYDGERHNPNNMSNLTLATNLKNKKKLMTAATNQRFIRGFNMLKAHKYPKMPAETAKLFKKIFAKYDIFSFPIPPLKNPKHYDYYYTFCNILNYPAIIFQNFQYVANTGCDLALIHHVNSKK